MAVHAAASGKVLLIGGYLVLDRMNCGLVIAVSARFHAVIYANNCIFKDSKRNTNTNTTLENIKTLLIVVEAPQRETRPLVYAIDVIGASIREGVLRWRRLNSTHQQQDQEQHQEQTRNPFVDFTLKHALDVITAVLPEKQLHEKIKETIHIKLHGDTPFYAAKEHNDHGGQSARHDTKTGLGSSAALTAALTAALFAHFGMLPCHKNTENTQKMTQDQEKMSTETLLMPTACTEHQRDVTAHWSAQKALELAHNVAQLAHCHAQGKVGSGFDVSAAFFGTQTYQRYDPDIVKHCIERSEAGCLKAELAALLMPDMLQNVESDQRKSKNCCFAGFLKSRQNWNQLIQPLLFPRGICLMLADVKGGSSTPDMVQKVLAWRARQPSSKETPWTRLQSLNERFAQALQKLTYLSDIDALEYDEALEKLATLPRNQWDDATILCSASIRQAFKHAADIYDSIRIELREMGRESGVEIEPLEQTRLLDATLQLAGVLCSGIPGAGGEDAIFALVLQPQSAKNLVEQLVERSWQKLSSVSGRSIERLPVHNASGGIYLECINVSN